MALIECPECKTRVSDLADMCPSCGYPIKKLLEKKIVTDKISDININNNTQTEITQSIEQFENQRTKKSVFKTTIKSLIVLSSIVVIVICIANSIKLRNNPNSNKIETTANTTTETTVNMTTETTTNPVFSKSTKEIYDIAYEYLEDHRLDDARELYLFLGNYENSENYIKLIDFLFDISGTYYYENINHEFYKFTITYDNVIVEAPNGYKETYKIMEVSVVDEPPYILAKSGHGNYVISMEYGSVYFESIGYTLSNPLPIEGAKLYNSESYQPPKEPAIGMTADEVKESTWGSPNKINKTTTIYGVHEQWVYSNNKYIYLDDGIVSSIQE